MNGSPVTAVKLLACYYEVMVKYWKKDYVKMVTPLARIDRILAVA
jgi:hypothetical protein